MIRKFCERGRAHQPRPTTPRAARFVAAAVAIACTGSSAPLMAAAPGVSFSTVAANAYAAGDTNSCAIDLNSLTTVGNYQFIAYYNTADDIMIGRRTLGSSTWQTYSSGITVTPGDVADDHDVIAIAVDSSGYMHMGWGMHNVPLDYAISNSTVTGSTLGSLAFTTQTSTNAPTLFPQSGATTNEVTYPQFYNVPGSSDLLFAYRNGGSGGGSGNGNEYFDVYDPSKKTWTNNLIINGELTSVNAYLNSMAYTSAGNLLLSWTWRATSNWQTNSNIMFAQANQTSAGAFTLYKQGGVTQYDLPLIQRTVSGTGGDTDAKSVAQVVKTIPQGDSFINQTSMTVDSNNNPIIATYFAPGFTATSSTSGTGNPNRQYMLVYYDGSQWRTSQISNRTSDTAVDYSGGDVRDLGRPIVLVDKQGHVLVVTRSEDSAMGSYANPATANNDIVVYYNSLTSLDGATPAAWQSITLDTANMGEWEPTYDANLWASANVLDLFYEPVGLAGQTSATVSVLEWNEQSYFASVPESASLGLVSLLAAALVRPRSRRFPVVPQEPITA